MKKLILLGLCSILGAHFGWADDGTRAAQSALKAKGFYFGELDGELSAETAAAIKRFQIRNALDVTGTLTPQTSEALNQGDEKPETPPAASPGPSELPAVPASRVPPQSAVPERVPVWGLRETPSPAKSADAAQSAGRTSEALEAGGYPQLFAKTPFASAPLEVQRSTVRRAQALLSRDEIFHEAIDGQPGAAFEEALLIYQRRARLALSGRLDLETLSQMRLLPGAGGGGPALQPFNAGSVESHEPKKLYRGVWIR